MATVTKGRTFVSGETVTPAKLNELVDNATVTAIQTADISDSAVTNTKIASGVDASKLTTGTLPADRIGSGAITTARINDAAVTAAKLDGAQTGSAPIYGCRAWVSFNGTTSPPTVNASGNVSSVTRSQTGVYVINFSTSLPISTPCVVVTRASTDGYGTSRIAAVSASSVTVGTGITTTGAAENSSLVCVAVFA